MAHKERNELIEATKRRTDFVASADRIDTDRINVTVDCNDMLVISVDLHYLRVDESRRLLHNIIAITRNQFILKVIHGHVHGNSIREMVQNDDYSDRIVRRHVLEYNEGTSLLDIAA